MDPITNTIMSVSQLVPKKPKEIVLNRKQRNQLPIYPFNQAGFGSRMFRQNREGIAKAKKGENLRETRLVREFIGSTALVKVKGGPFSSHEERTERNTHGTNIAYIIAIREVATFAGRTTITTETLQSGGPWRLFVTRS